MSSSASTDADAPRDNQFGSKVPLMFDWGVVLRRMERKLFPKQRFTGLVALGLALLTVVFAVGVAAHVHTNSLSDSACLICHLAHIGPIPSCAFSGLAVPVVLTRIFLGATLPMNLKPFARDHSSHAPPA